MKYIVYYTDEKTSAGIMRLYNTVPMSKSGMEEAREGIILCKGVSSDSAFRRIVQHTLASECVFSASPN